MLPCGAILFPVIAGILISAVGMEEKVRTWLYAAAAAVTAAVCRAVAVNRGNVETAPDKQESRQSVTTSGESSAGEESKEESSDD